MIVSPRGCIFGFGFDHLQHTVNPFTALCVSAGAPFRCSAAMLPNVGSKRTNDTTKLPRSRQKLTGCLHQGSNQQPFVLQSSHPGWLHCLDYLLSFAYSFLRYQEFRTNTPRWQQNEISEWSLHPATISEAVDNCFVFVRTHQHCAH